MQTVALQHSVKEHTIEMASCRKTNVIVQTTRLVFYRRPTSQMCQPSSPAHVPPLDFVSPEFQRTKAAQNILPQPIYGGFFRRLRSVYWGVHQRIPIRFTWRFRATVAAEKTSCVNLNC